MWSHTRVHAVARPLAALVVVSLSVTLTVALQQPAGAQAKVRLESTPTPSPSPGAGGRRSTSPGVVLVFALLAAAVVWQVQRGRRSAQEYALSATDHFERTIAPPPPPPEDRTDSE